MLEVLKGLLASGDIAAVLELVSQLVARNGELEKKLAELLSRGRTNEGVSTAQLLLLLDGLAAQPVPAPDVADAMYQRSCRRSGRRHAPPALDLPRLASCLDDGHEAVAGGGRNPRRGSIRASEIFCCPDAF